jgi:hypothetical protein
VVHIDRNQGCPIFLGREWYRAPTVGKDVEM